METRGVAVVRRPRNMVQASALRTFVRADP
jgi:hypothetical protein